MLENDPARYDGSYNFRDPGTDEERRRIFLRMLGHLQTGYDTLLKPAMDVTWLEDTEWWTRLTPGELAPLAESLQVLLQTTAEPIERLTAGIRAGSIVLPHFKDKRLFFGFGASYECYLSGMNIEAGCSTGGREETLVTSLRFSYPLLQQQIMLRYRLGQSAEGKDRQIRLGFTISHTQFGRRGSTSSRFSDDMSSTVPKAHDDSDIRTSLFAASELTIPRETTASYELLGDEWYRYYDGTGLQNATNALAAASILLRASANQIPKANRDS